MCNVTRAKCIRELSSTLNRRIGTWFHIIDLDGDVQCSGPEAKGGARGVGRGGIQVGCCGVPSSKGEIAMGWR
jgi:hypothetical protein